MPAEELLISTVNTFIDQVNFYQQLGTLHSFTVIALIIKQLIFKETDLDTLTGIQKL
jgi:hypothetical protein